MDMSSSTVVGCQQVLLNEMSLALEVGSVRMFLLSQPRLKNLRRFGLRNAADKQELLEVAGDFLTTLPVKLAA